MKRITAIMILIALAAMLLCACGVDPLYNNSATTATEATESETVSSDVSKSDYDDSFSGMLKYLADKELISSKEGDSAELYAEVLGAENAVRYTLSSTAFIEFYEYGKERNETAEKVFEEIKTEGKFEIAGLEPLTGVISDSGSYLAVYNADINYDYDSILEEFKKF